MRRAVGLTAAACAAAAMAAAQVPGTFRSTVTLVPVDVRVLDAEGNPIAGLTQNDFTVFENGVAQPIRHFAYQALGVESESPSPAQPAAIASPKYRTFLILFGRGRHHHPAHGVEATVRFVKERLLPTDQVAVFAFNRATDFTTNHGEVVKLLEEFGRRHEAIDSKIALRFGGLAGVFGSKSLPGKVQTEIDEVFKVAGAPGFRTVPPGRVTDAGRIADDVRRATQTILHGDVTRSDVRGTFDLSLDEYILNNVGTMADLENLYTGIEYLRYLEGEKHVIFVTARGLFLPRVEDDHSLAAMANDARVVIDTIQTGGVPAGGDLKPGPTFTETFAMQTLRTMADLTGGHASIYAFAEKALDRIDRASRAQYLLGYAPPSATWDGRYRRIEVKVNRRDATVQYRHGYYARAQLVPYDRREFLTFSRISAAALYTDQIRDLKVKLKASYVRGEGRAGEVNAEIGVDITPVPLEIKDGRRSGVLDVAVFCFDQDGASAGERWEKMSLSFSEEEFTRARREGVKYVLPVSVRIAPKFVKVVVYDYVGDVIGSADTRIY
jgi:VWFA-related protein